MGCLGRDVAGEGGWGRGFVVVVVELAWPDRGLSPRRHSPATTTTVGGWWWVERGGGGKKRVTLNHACPICLFPDLVSPIIVLPIIIYNLIPPDSVPANSGNVIPGMAFREYTHSSLHSGTRKSQFGWPHCQISFLRIPGMARIPPDSGRNQWGTVKTSVEVT